MQKISEIINKNGYPQLCINGEIQDGSSYITYLTESDRFLFLHTAEDGAYTLNVKAGEGLVNVLTREPFVQGQYLKKGKSFIFERCECVV